MDFCRQHQLATDKTELVHEMVALHNSMGVADKKDPEIALLHFGAGLDVAGLNIHDAHPATVSEILEQYPRLNF